MPKKNKLSILLRMFFSLALLGLLLYLGRENFGKILALLKSTDIIIFSLAFLIFMISVVFTAWRLEVVLSGQDVFLSLNKLFPLTLIGYFFTNFMPTTVGGDLVKGHYISKINQRKLSAYTSVFIDRVLGMFSVALIATVALLVINTGIKHKFIFWAIAFIFISCCLFAVSLFCKDLLRKLGKLTGITRLTKRLKIDSSIKKAYAALTIYTTRKDLVLKGILLSALAQIAVFVSIFFLAKSLSVHLPLGNILLVMPVIFVLCILPITMNGLGLREWAFVFFFSPYIGSAAALSLSLLYLAMFLLSSLIGGIIYLFWK